MMVPDLATPVTPGTPPPPAGGPQLVRGRKSKMSMKVTPAQQQEHALRAQQQPPQPQPRRRLPHRRTGRPATPSPTTSAFSGCSWAVSAAVLLPWLLLAGWADLEANTTAQAQSDLHTWRHAASAAATREEAWITEEAQATESLLHACTLQNAEAAEALAPKLHALFAAGYAPRPPHPPATLPGTTPHRLPPSLQQLIPSAADALSYRSPAGGTVLHHLVAQGAEPAALQEAAGHFPAAEVVNVVDGGGCTVFARAVQQGRGGAVGWLAAVPGALPFQPCRGGEWWWGAASPEAAKRHADATHGVSDAARLAGDPAFAAQLAGLAESQSRGPQACTALGVSGATPASLVLSSYWESILEGAEALCKVAASIAPTLRDGGVEEVVRHLLSWGPVEETKDAARGRVVAWVAEVG